MLSVWVLLVHPSTFAVCFAAEGERTMIDGLNLTFSGDELRKLLEDRIAAHNRSADRWQRERSRTKESETEDEPLLPDHMCEHEHERHAWRAHVLEFIRDRVDAQETYRLGVADLERVELLPQTPASIEQEEYEERNAVSLQLEQLVKRVGQLTGGCAAAAAHYDIPAGYKVTRVDIEDGPEVIRIDRTDTSE